MFKQFLHNRIIRRSALLFGSLGLLFGVIYGLGGLIVDILVSLEWISSNETPGLSIGTILALMALVIMPLIGFGFGILVGLIIHLIQKLFS